MLRTRDNESDEFAIELSVWVSPLMLIEVEVHLVVQPKEHSGVTSGVVNLRLGKGSRAPVGQLLGLDQVEMEVRAGEELQRHVRRLVRMHRPVDQVGVEERLCGAEGCEQLMTPVHLVEIVGYSVSNLDAGLVIEFFSEMTVQSQHQLFIAG